MKSNISPSLEDYLEAIYMIDSENSGVRLTDVANNLKVSKPSVNKAMVILKEKNLIIHEKYGEIRLTEEGLKIAIHVISKHRSILKFLTKILKVDKETAEIEACKIEHVISDDTAEKMIKFINEN